MDASVDRSMSGLEVGPAYSPQFPRKGGWNVETLDRMSADKLRDACASIDDVSRIEHIDFIHAGSDIDSAIGRTGCYDFIYASHFIEHTPNPIRFIQGCERLLKPNGSLLLAILDKRRCFDVLPPLTTTGNWIDANFGQNTKHDTGRVFDSLANRVSLSGVDYRKSLQDDGEKLDCFISEAANAFNRAKAGTHHVNIHAWRFTPSSFRKIVHDLHALGYTELKEMAFIPTDHFEFFFSLSRNGQGCERSSFDLRLDMAREELEGLSQIEGV